MSVNKGNFNILDDEVAGRLVFNIDSSLLLNDQKQDIINSFVLSKKPLDRNIIKKNLAEKISGIQTNVKIDDKVNCSFGQNLYKNCTSVCVTCKSSCYKCFKKSFKNSYSDTHDFDKYLGTLSRKVKVQPKVKSIGVDTCDLEGHFDYYKLEKKTVKILKHVATDCTGLNIRKPEIRKPTKNSVAVDTRDLDASLVKTEENDESDCDFFWYEEEKTRTYSITNKKSNTSKLSIISEKLFEDDISENSLVIDEDSSLHPSLKNGEDNKENFNAISSTNDTSISDSSSSDESDINLATSCKVFRCRELAKKHNIKLKKVNSESGKLFKCNICEKTFHKKYLGDLHIGNHIENNFLKCLSCNDKFESLEVLFSHVKENHLDEGKNDKSEREKMSVVENKENSEIDLLKSKIFKCTLCSGKNRSKVLFNSSKALLIHKKEKHGVDGEKESEGEFKIERRGRIKREYICLLCGKQFKSSKALKDHSPVHTGAKNYHCDICNKSYTTSANLKIHKRTHTGAKDFVCSVCNKAFHKKDSLKVHFRKHSGERPFQCDLCPMKFDRNYILKNHRYTHFSEKTFICPVCGKTFTTHGGLNNHEKSHRKDPGAKKPRKPAVKPTLDTENAVICDVCGKIYSTRNNLRVHKFVHLGVKPFECTICHQTYAKKDSMLIHMRKHTDERPFACETCGMTFYRNHTLKTHLLRHTGERPHKCKICGKSFTQSSSLMYHIRNHGRRVERKKIIPQETLNQKKKKKKMGAPRKIFKFLKKTEHLANLTKPVLADKKPEESSSEIPKDSLVLNVSEKGSDEILRGGHFMLPVPEKDILVLEKNLDVEFPKAPEKDILVLEKNLDVEFPKAPEKDIDFFSFDKDISCGNQYNEGKLNYFIGKSHVFSFPKETVKPKTGEKEIEVVIDKGVEDVEDVENLIISKNSFITKEGNLVTFNKEPTIRGDKEEFVEIEGQRLDLKAASATIPITGEILNAAFISEENGDVIPLSSMTLQGLNSENLMIGSFVQSEGEDGKDFLRNSKVSVLDSKMAYNLAEPVTINDKTLTKGSGHVISLRDTRLHPKIQIELESNSLHAHAPATDSVSIHDIPEYYTTVQQNHI